MIARFKKLVFMSITICGLLAYSSFAKEDEGGKPNIIIVLVDDMGYSDLGCYGGEIETPNIDKLAASGIRFTQMYNCARCCPTRASLLTGHYPHQVGMAGMGKNLNMKAATIAEILKLNGYHTGMAGKWHLSLTKARENPDEQLRWLAHQADYGSFSPLENYPVNRGFEEHWGVIWGVVNYFDPFSLVHNENPIKEVGHDFYMTDFITKKSIDLIDQFSKDNDPFFLYVAHNAPHWPLHALPDDIEKYKDTYSEGWDVLRGKRYHRMIELNLINSTTCKLPENSSGKKWDNCLEKEKEVAGMAVHAAMVDRIDHGIGKIIQKLKETGQYDNTVIFILSDNGASYERGYPPGFDRPGFKRDSTEIIYNADHPGAENTWNYLGNAWASAVNTPFRFWKRESYEGGICTPFIVHWPIELKAKKKTINHGVGHVMDILPTCLELAEAEYPSTINGMETVPPEGKSLLPLINRQIAATHDTLFWEHEGGRAVRVGNWKVSALRDSQWELFNLEKDRTESNNLAKKYPKKVTEMNALWDEY